MGTRDLLWQCHKNRYCNIVSKHSHTTGETLLLNAVLLDVTMQQVHLNVQCFKCITVAHTVKGFNLMIKSVL